MERNCNKKPVPIQYRRDLDGNITGFDYQRGSGAMFRWWLPAGFLDRDEISREIRETAKHGFRGLEICVNMADTKYAEEELAEKGWGTPHWREMYKHILRTANEYGIQIDMTISPGWPAGIPGVGPEDDCTSKELLTCTMGPFKGTYEGILSTEIDPGVFNPNAQDGPPHGPGEEVVLEKPQNRMFLEAVTAARVESTREIPMLPGRFGPPSPRMDGPTTTQYRLELDSMQVVNSIQYHEESDSYTVSFVPPEKGEWLLFAFWRRGTAQTNRQGSATAQPCYAVDHMNRRGAEAVIAFWEKHILDDELRTLIAKNGGVIFEDSIELDLSDFAIHWGMEHLSRFRESRGYDLTPYLPLLTSLTYMDPKDYKYEIGDGQGGVSDLGTRIRNDYCQLVTELYAKEHIGPIQDWAASLGMGYRSQGYGLPFDLMAIAACSHGPEGESLAFGQGVRGDDRFRTIAGGAHTGNRPIISDEMGAVAGAGYRWTWKSMLDIINQNFTGANLIIFHGMPYAVSNVSKWPGYSPFGFGLSGQWGPRQPEWAYIDDLAGYVGRTQSVLQCGKPVVDLAILSVYYEGFNFDGMFQDQTMAKQGYTYDYISVNSLELPGARVRDGVLFPDGAGYRGLIVDSQSMFTERALKKLRAYADDGLKIVLVGQMPCRAAYFSEQWQADDEGVRSAAETLLSHQNVGYAARQQDVPDALRSMGIVPGAEVEAPADLMTVHRRSAEGDYYYIHYREKEPGAVALKLQGEGTVYRMDPWNGRIYAVASAGHRVKLDMSPQETAILWVTEQPVLAENSAENQELLRILEGWSMSFERWEQDPEGADTTATKKTVIALRSVPTRPWTEISEIGREASGIAAYENRFVLSSCQQEHTYLVDLRNVKCQSVHLYINGTKVPVDHLTMTAKCRGVMKQGENQIRLLVISTLGNQLIAYGAFPKMPWMQEEELPAEFGICGDIVIYE